MDTGWIEEFPGLISVCDKDGKILVMNQKIVSLFPDRDGKAFIGTNLLDCHGQASGAQVRKLLAEQKMDIYIAEENDCQELVIHAPWYKDGEFAGLVEIAVPVDLPIRHLRR